MDNFIVEEFCGNCGTVLEEAVDSDPNGLLNATCARCRVEEAHDFDAEPDVEFTRGGRVKED